jgi:hypothetical protein
MQFPWVTSAIDLRHRISQSVLLLSGVQPDGIRCQVTDQGTEMSMEMDLSGSLLFNAEAYGKAFKDAQTGMPLYHPGHSKLTAHTQAIAAKMESIGEHVAFMTVPLPTHCDAPGYVSAEPDATRLIQLGQADNKELYMNAEMVSMASLTANVGSKPLAVDISTNQHLTGTTAVMLNEETTVGMVNEVRPPEMEDKTTAGVVDERNAATNPLPPLPDDNDDDLAEVIDFPPEEMETKMDVNNKRAHVGDNCTREELKSTEGTMVLYSYDEKDSDESDESEVAIPKGKKSKSEFLLLHKEFDSKESIIEDAWKNYSTNDDDDEDEISITDMLENA